MSGGDFTYEIFFLKQKHPPILFGRCFLWLGWRDSDPRDAGVKVLCLTAWRQPNISFYILIKKKGFLIDKKPFYGVGSES